MKAFIGVLILCGTYSLTYSAFQKLELLHLCADQEDGELISIPGECSKFYICFDGEEILLDCGAGAHFDPITRTCINELNSRCVQGSTVLKPEPRPGEISCAYQQDGILLPVPGECSQFYICSNGKEVPSNCGVGAHFDPTTRTCIEEAKSLCVQGHFPSNSVPETESKQEVRPEPEPKPEPKPELKPEPKPESKPESKPEQKPEPKPELKPEPKPEYKPEQKPEPKPELKPKPESQPEPKPELKPELKPEPKPESKPEQKPESNPKVKPKQKPEAKPDQKPESKPEKAKATKNICVGKAIGAFIPSNTNCNEFYVCVGSNPILKKCQEGQNFNPDLGSCIDAKLSSCKVKNPVEVKEKPKQPQQTAPIGTTIFAETICLGQPNGAMFPAPGSCSKYFACLQQKAIELTCGQRHFDPSGRSCIEADASECIEDEVLSNLEIVITAVKTGNDDNVQIFAANEIGDTEIGTGSNGVLVGSANIQIDNSGSVRDMNIISSSSNLEAGNTNLGSYNSYYITNNSSSGQNKSIAAAADMNAIQTQNASIGNTDLGRNNTGVFIGNANLSINNTGTISNANIVTASKDVEVGNTDLGSSNTYIISGGKIIGNNKIIPIKQTGLPVNKKQVSQIEKLDIDVSSSGISVDAAGVVTASGNGKDVGIGDANLGAGNSGIFIGNANVDISNTGYVSDVNLVSGTSNAVVGNTDLGYNNQVVVEGLQIEKENKEIVLAIIDEDSADACNGIISGTLLPKSGSCTDFLTCENGVAFTGKCPRGLHFNAKAKFCDWPEFAGCA